MANVSGVAIHIRAFLPTGKTIAEQMAALTLVTKAHETGDYAELLKVAKIDDVKTETKTRRIDETPPKQLDLGNQGGTTDGSPESTGSSAGMDTGDASGSAAGETGGTDTAGDTKTDDAGVPDFVKGRGRKLPSA